MQILECTLFRFKRLALSGIEKIRYTPEQEVQVIIGSNGSGKSSLMDELNPLPPDKSSMNAGGYKRIKIKHGDETYTLLSEYSGKNTGKHSFIQHGLANDIVLNDKGTLSAQKILIEQIFGITTEAMELWVGRKTFSGMSPTQRRDWIIKLSGSDLPFAMKLYNKVRSEKRDAQGVVKHYSKRLAEETADIADQNRIEELESQVNVLTAELNQLFSGREQNIPSVGTIQFEISQLQQEFESCANEILTLRLVKPHAIPKEINNVHGVEVLIGQLVTELQMVNRAISDKYSERESIGETIRLMSQNGAVEVKDVKDKIKELNKQVKELKEVTPLYEDLKDSDFKVMIGSFKSCRGMLTDLLSTMYDNSDRHYTKDRVNETRILVDSAKKALGGKNESLSRLKHSQEHFEGVKEIDCPKCSHGFKPGFAAFDPTGNKNLIDSTVKEIEALEKVLAVNTKYLEGASEYSNQVRTLKRIMNDNSVLIPLWSAIVSEGLYKVAPITHMVTVNNFITSLENSAEIDGLYTSIESNETILKTLTSSKDSSALFTTTHLEKLDLSLEESMVEQKKLNLAIDECTKYVKHITRAENANKRLVEITQTIQSKLEIIVKSIRNQVIGEATSERQIKLAHLKNAITRISHSETVLKELSASKDNAIVKYRDYELLENILSPQTGVIAKYIQNFIDVFISEMNMIIDFIWTYPLEVLGCSIDSDDVTCKFPLSIMDGYLVTSDITEGSTGQRDIVDFSFRFILGKYLGLKDMPLYLDEIGTTLDEQHRVNFIRYLSSILESGTYNQMFMISHYSANHFAFPNTDFTLLNERNINTKPPEYNTCIEFEFLVEETD